MSKKILLTTSILFLATAIWYAGITEAQDFVTNGLLGFWTLDQSEIKGNTVQDIWGETDGNIAGDPEIVGGKIEEGLEFDGDDRVEISKELMVGLESFTIEAWFNYDNSANWRWIVGGGPEWNHGVGMCIYSGSNILRYHLKTDSGEFTDGNGSTSLEPGTWYHAAYTYDGDVALGYVDGEAQFERAITGAVAIDVSTLAIGGGYWQNNEYFVGIIDEVRIYDRALNEDEVNQNFEVTSNQLAVEPSGKLSTYWGKVKNSM